MYEVKLSIRYRKSNLVPILYQLEWVDTEKNKVVGAFGCYDIMSVKEWLHTIIDHYSNNHVSITMGFETLKTFFSTEMLEFIYKKHILCAVLYEIQQDLGVLNKINEQPFKMDIKDYVYYTDLYLSRSEMEVLEWMDGKFSIGPSKNEKIQEIVNKQKAILMSL